MGDIWLQHESIIRKIYQDDDKTLKELKQIMEQQHGFPNTIL